MGRLSRPRGSAPPDRAGAAGEADEPPERWLPRWLPTLFSSHAPRHAIDRAVLVSLTVAFCGLRWGELAALRVRNVDLMRRRLEVAADSLRTGGEVISMPQHAAGA